MTQTAKPKRRATTEDLLSLPENCVGEIIDGELIVSPRPSSKHALAATWLTTTINSAFGSKHTGGPGGWVILIEPELHLGSDVLVPDLAGWRVERMPEVPDIPYFETAPDWICEILSPGNAALDRVRKVPKYSTHEVKYLWLVDPTPRTLEAFRLENGKWVWLVTHGENEKVRVEPFESFEIDLGVIWGTGKH